ncbi:hypothetical protein ACFQ0G_19535 [Streptomyces chiangmaiensis]
MEFNRTGLWLTLSRGGRRQRTQVIQYRNLPDGTRAILTIVDRPTPSINMVWVAWDPDRMSLEYTSREVLATAEAELREGDARTIDTGEMLDCFTGDHTAYWPHRDVEVRVGGLWRPGRLRCLYRGPRGRAVALVMTSLYEPDWGHGSRSSGCTAGIRRRSDRPVHRTGGVERVPRFGKHRRRAGRRTAGELGLAGERFGVVAARRRPYGCGRHRRIDEPGLVVDLRRVR